MSGNLTEQDHKELLKRFKKRLQPEIKKW